MGEVERRRCWRLEEDWKRREGMKIADAAAAEGWTEMEVIGVRKEEGVKLMGLRRLRGRSEEIG
jgi:hypothetical protein